MDQEHETRIKSSPVGLCETKRELSANLAKAIREMVDLLNAQIEAVLFQDEDFSRFDDLIHLARINKEQAKYALVAHIGQHQC